MGSRRAAGPLAGDSIPFDGGTPGDVAVRVVEALTEDGAEVVAVGAARYRLTCRYRPRWALVTAIATAPTLLGLAFLFVRRTDTSVLEFDSDRVRITGRIAGSAVTTLRMALRAAEQPATHGFRVAPAEPVRAGPVRAGPVRAGPVGVEPVRAEPVRAEPAISPTVHKSHAQPKLASLAPLWTARQYVVEFDTGREEAVDGPAVAGRDPVGEPGTRRIRLDDVDLSVSKTHFALGVDNKGFWIADRESTNGTAIRRANGDILRCEPGQPVYVGSRDVVRFGDHTFTVRPVSAGERTGGVNGRA